MYPQCLSLFSSCSSSRDFASCSASARFVWHEAWRQNRYTSADLVDPSFIMVELDRGMVFKIVAMSLAGGDVLQTMPATYTLYKKQWTRRRLSAVCFFFAVARYMSILSLASNVLGLGTFFGVNSMESCKRVYMFPNVTALIAGMAVQILVYIRTYAISGRSNYVRFGLGIILLLGFPAQIFGIVYHRDPSFSKGVCKGRIRGRIAGGGETDWNIVYYSAHMAFDLIGCATATYYLVSSSRIQRVIRFSKLLRRVLRDGLLYFVVVFLVNLWVVLEFANAFKSGAASALPIAVVLIAAQHLVLSTQSLITSDGPSIETNGQSISRGPPRFYHRNHSVELESAVFDTIISPHDQKASLNSTELVDKRVSGSSAPSTSKAHVQ
ncbi:hypothetical protein C8R43DRAFT_1036914 [Mycena crocata]|nr:hypothetical protein C8R43DRAFT_1036914 [Mycena crocata]